MNCWPCFDRDEDSDSSPSKKNQSPASNQVPDSANVKTFSFRELAMATKNFRQECLLGEGGFGRVFRGMIQASGMVVAVKQLDRNGMQGNKEFTNEAVKLSLLNHANLVNLIGYCADGDQRVLVYEYVPMGSLDQHLFGDGPDTKPLDWSTRMNLASGAAQALEYLHEKANPPVIYGDLKSSNVLLNEKFEPKLSDVGLSKFGAGDGTIEQGSRMMATYGYSAPEYSKGGEVTLKSDIYSFGVVLLELITGRRAIDTSRPIDEQNLVTWAQPFFRDPKRFSEMADPRLNKQFHATSLNQAVGIAAMCIQDEPMVRPLISDVTSVLSCICMIPNVPPQPQKMKDENEMQHKTPKQQDKHSAECDSSSSSDSEDTESRDQQSGECHDSDDGSSEHDRSGQVSDRESGSDDESDDQSDEESTYNSDGGASDEYESSPGGKPQRTKTKRAKSRQQKAEMEGVPSSGSPRQTVVTFKEPSKSSRYSPGGKSQSSSSSSSEENSSESEDEGVSSRHQEKYSTDYSDATENGLSSSHDDDRESDSS